MKMTIRLLALLLVLTLAAGAAAGCGKKPNESTPSSSLPGSEPNSDPTSIVPPDETGGGSDPTQTGAAGTTAAAGTPTKTDRTSSSTSTQPNRPSTDTDQGHYQHSTGKTFQNMTFTYKAVSAAFDVKKTYTVQELGLMQLEDYPIDGVYDNAFNILYINGVYRMWWCRACPFDTVWYAESKDLKNWYNAQCVIDLHGVQTTYMKEMLSWPSVLYVDGKYHMFFETPAKIAESGEYSNNILYATSKDGLKWTFYPNNKDPKPVIVNPNVREGVYGVGQPKAFYKDGYFYVVYTDATSGGGTIRVARSKGNGYSFEGTVASHTKLLTNVAGAAVRYNKTTNKYYMMFGISETQSDGVYNDNLYIMESSDLYNWPCKTRAEALTNAACVTRLKDVTKKSNIDLVTDACGIVSGEDMYVVNMVGKMPKQTEDHRNTHTTWDGRLGIISTGSKYGKTPTLPNGKTGTAANLKWYEDRVAAWKRPSAEAAKGTPKIDGTRDAVYGSGKAAKAETVTWSYEDCKPTKTTGKIEAAWDENALYLYAEVKDANGVFTNATIDKPGNLWRNDSIVAFIDVPNTMTGTENKETLTPLSYMVIVDAAGKWVIKDSGENVISSEFSGVQTSAKKTSAGYVIEAKIPWYPVVQSQIKAGKKIGIDFSINDNFGTSADREAQVYWSDPTGDSFLYLDHYGELTLK